MVEVEVSAVPTHPMLLLLLLLVVLPLVLLLLLGAITSASPCPEKRRAASAVPVWGAPKSGCESWRPVCEGLDLKASCRRGVLLLPLHVLLLLVP